jgi:FtsP/CotA-like multicopper oxidase with cupredoxin domain
MANFPGPLIEARSGDGMVIEILNGLEIEGVSIHFYGLHMKGSNDMDGAVGVTQDPIPPGGRFNYRF